MVGFYNSETNKWLDNDFQMPNFASIEALAVAKYGSIKAFELQHGPVNTWKKTAISTAAMEQIIPPAKPEKGIAEKLQAVEARLNVLENRL